MKTSGTSTESRAPAPPGSFVALVDEIERAARRKAVHPLAFHGARPLAAQIACGTYRAARRSDCKVRKSGGGFRRIEVPCERDLVAISGLTRWAKFAGHFPRREDPILVVRRLMAWRERGYLHAYRFDFKDFFPSIDLESCLASAAVAGVPETIRRFIASSVAAGSLTEADDVVVRNGLPQGCAFSGPVAELYIRPIREALCAARGCQCEIFVDDGVIVARDAKELREGVERLEETVRTLGLVLGSKDDCGYFTPEQPVPFLGFLVGTREVSVAPSRVARFQRRLRRRVIESTDIRAAVANINNTLTASVLVGYKRVGWLRYYSMADIPTPFVQIDRRIRNHLRNKFGCWWSNKRLERLGLRSAYRDARALRALHFKGDR